MCAGPEAMQAVGIRYKKGCPRQPFPGCREHPGSQKGLGLPAVLLFLIRPIVLWIRKQGVHSDAGNTRRSGTGRQPHS